MKDMPSMQRVARVFLTTVFVMSGISWHAAAPTTAGQTTASAPLLSFSSDVVLITVLIKPDKTADFEKVLDKLKEALQRSDKPERRQQAEGWTVLKSTQSVNGNTAYIMRLDPVIKGQEYDITRLIAEVFPVEVQQVFPLYKEAFAGRAITELTPVLSMTP